MFSNMPFKNINETRREPYAIYNPIVINPAPQLIINNNNRNASHISPMQSNMAYKPVVKTPFFN